MTELIGTDANDTLTGTDENDIIFGRSGDDTLSGLIGNDFLFGEAGNDKINGNNGSDRLFGGDDSDSLNGGYDDDFLYGGDGNDFLLGSIGNDNLYAGDGNDQLYGSVGNDGLYGSIGNDNLYGSFGNDTLNGGNGNDRLDGAGAPGESNVTSRGEGEIDVLTGGTGSDTFVLQGNDLSGQGPHYLGGGKNDYALITDFNKSEDVIELRTAEYIRRTPAPITVEYSLGASPEGLPSGAALFADNVGTKPDLIAILQGVDPNSVSLSDSYFKFV